MPPLRVVCLGSGWVSFYLSKAIRPAVRRGEVDLTVIGRENFHTFHGFIPEMLVGRIQPTQILAPSRRLVQPGRFVNAHIQAIDLERREITVQRLLDTRTYTVPYDHLVLGLGSRDATERGRGLAEHAFRLRSAYDALACRNHLISVLEMAELEEDEIERRRLLTFVVAGGNFGGIEVAAELEEFARQAARKTYPRINPDEVRVVVVHPGKRILPELDPHHLNLLKWAEDYLATQRIEFQLGRRLASATAEEAVLDDGTRIPTRTIISCVGTGVNPLIAALPFERDERGRVRTDATGRVLGVENVWAAGDCSAIPHPKGGTCPPLAVWAMMEARRVGLNLALVSRREAPKPLGFTGLGDACSLGRRRAVAHLKGIPIVGVAGWVLWRIFALGFIPTWDRRLRLLLDWLLVPLSGREMVQMQSNERVGVVREVFEPGQEIVRQGELGVRLYLVSEGEVAVVQRGDDGAERQLATLGPGEHFGEMAVFKGTRRTATVRAVSRVAVLSLGKQEAVALSDTVRTFGEELRAVPRAATPSTAPTIPQ